MIDPLYPELDHTRPEGATDEAVEAAGKASEALEYLERARGHLFSLHQLIGRADLLFGEAAEILDRCDPGLARMLREEVVGRNVLDGRWTFQIVEEFEDHYYEPIRAAEKRIRDELMEGRRHVYEFEMKQRRHYDGQP